MHYTTPQSEECFLERRVNAAFPGLRKASCEKGEQVKQVPWCFSDSATKACPFGIDFWHLEHLSVSLLVRKILWVVVSIYSIDCE